MARKVPAAFITTTGSDSIASSGSYQPVTFDTVTLDTDNITSSWYPSPGSSSSPHATIQTSGVYLVCASIRLGNQPAEGTYRGMRVISSTLGSILRWQLHPHSLTSTNFSMRASAIVSLDRGDTLTLTAGQNSGGAVTVSSVSSSLVIVWVGKQ